MLIAIEGLDGVGKTTLGTGLARHFGSRGRRVVRLRRFMIPEITELWWRLVDADGTSQRDTAVLAGADHRIGLTRFIRPALADGAIVVVDKYVYSHLVFFAVRGLDLGWLKTLFADTLLPDRVLHLVAPVPLALKRLQAVDGKPDLLEAGLDYRLGCTIGGAFRRYGLGGAPPELRARHFLEHQRAMETLFPDVVPRDVTHVVDAARPEHEVLRECVHAIDA
jgi:dTMP kinase